MNDNLDYEAWRCSHDIKLFCPDEGCSLKDGCARDKGWSRERGWPVGDVTVLAVAQLRPEEPG